MTALVEGPAWAQQGLDQRDGRYPLAVEAPVLGMVATLMPGVSTLTDFARYYALYWALADYAERHDLDGARCQQILRRSEVLLALATRLTHDGEVTAHGADALQRGLIKGRSAWDLAETGKSSYSPRAWAFWSQYGGPSDVLGTATTEDGAIRPSRHACPDYVRDRTIELVVVCGVATEVTVECSSDGAPGSWQPRGVFAVSAASVARALTWTADSPEPAGAAVRLVATVDGAVVESVPAFVTDPHRCRARWDVSNAPQLRAPYELDSIIKDPGVLERFSRDLLNLLRLSAEQRATTATLRTPAEASSDVDARAKKDAWTEFLDHAAHSLGASLTELAFPGALPSPTSTVAPSGWVVGVIEDETELAEDETESDIAQLESLVGREARRVAPEARARYRSWIRRWVKAITSTPAAPGPPLPMRMTVAALYLELLAAGVWGADDGWRDELADVVVALVADRDEIDDSPEESHAYLGSLVAVCLAVLGQDATVRGGRPADIVLTRAWKPAHGVATLAEDVVIDSLLLRSDEVGARLAGRSEVAAAVELAREAVTDPKAETLAGMVAAGFEVDSEHGAWVVRGTFRHPMRPAAQAATELFDGEPLTCVATTGTRSVIMVRGEDAVAMLDSAVGRWRVYPLRRPRTPLTLFGQGEGVPATRQILVARPVPPAVTAIAGDADLEALLAKFGPGRRPQSKDGAWTDWDW